MRKLFMVLTMLVVLSTFTASAFAGDNVVHSTIPVVDGTNTFAAGPEAQCIGVEEDTLVTATFSGEFKLTEFVDGPQAGRFHLRGQVSGTFVIPSEEGIMGTFRQQVNDQGTGDDIVSNFVSHASGTTADGSEFKFVLHGHLVVQNDVVKVNFEKFSCIK